MKTMKVLVWVSLFLGLGLGCATDETVNSIGDFTEESCSIPSR